MKHNMWKSYGTVLRISRVASVLSVICCVQLRAELLTRWSFLAHADFYFQNDPILPMQPFYLSGVPLFDSAKVQPGDCIYMPGRCIPHFFKTFHKQISHPYIIISHGEYKDTFKPAYARYLNDPKIIAICGVHSCLQHPKFIPLPLGLKMKNYRSAQKMASMQKYLAELRAIPKTKLLYMNFSTTTNPERKHLQRMFSVKSYCTQGVKVSFKRYLREMAEHKFVLSPPGLGVDCYRTWEALLVGSIPIILDDSFYRCFYRDLPVLQVQSWKKVNRLFLERAYEHITTKAYAKQKLEMEHWVARIASMRATLRA